MTEKCHVKEFFVIWWQWNIFLLYSTSFFICSWSHTNLHKSWSYQEINQKFENWLQKLYIFTITLSYSQGGGCNHKPLSENCSFSITKPPLDLRPVCKFEFVRCGQVEKKAECSICLGLIMAVRQSSRTHFSQKLFSSIFYKMINSSKNSRGMSLKARGLLFWILTINIHI